MRMGARSQPHSGFTLVEILVVVAIIAVLMGLLIPVLMNSRSQARRIQCANNLRELHRGVNLYCMDNRMIYPILALKPTANEGVRLRDLLTPVLRDPRVFKCPEDRQGFFEKEGSSYEWNAALNGKPQDGKLEEILGSSRTPMLYDYENFHPDNGNGFGGKVVVFVDGNVVK